MTVEMELWSSAKRALFLATLAHELTVCARGTYEAGTTRVREPELLRDYNEIQHRIMSSLMTHLEATNGIPANVIVEMVIDFGERHSKQSLIEGAISRAQHRLSCAPNDEREH